MADRQSTPPTPPRHAAASAPADEGSTSRRTALGVAAATLLGLGAAAGVSTRLGDGSTAASGTPSAPGGGPTAPGLSPSPSPSPATTTSPTPSLPSPSPSASGSGAASAGTAGSRLNATQPNAAGGPTTRDASYVAGSSDGSGRIDGTASSTTSQVAGKSYADVEEAARAVGEATSTVFVASAEAHLLRRATFGPRPSDVAELKRLGLGAWIEQQLNPDTLPDAAGDRAWAAFPLAGASATRLRASSTDFNGDAMRETSWATLARQIFSSRQLYEQVVDLFANHLHVAIPSDDWDTTPSYVTDVLREHAFGTYRDMLRAAMRHPAMLRYLNNDVSTKTHVNENLGRELLELHTVGLAGGYTEDDVVASARVLTGRSVQDGTFLYRAERHHTGPLTVLDWSDPNPTAEGGLAVGDKYLDHLARHPATARTLATKIAVRFVSDAPPASLVDRLAATYLEHDTDIRAVLAVLFRSSEFWASVGLKSRRPLDDAVGLARVLDVGPGADLPAAVTSLYWDLSSAGHTPFGWDPPNGFPDVAPAWINAGGMVNRWSLHRSLVHNWGGRWAVPTVTDEVPAEADSTTGAWLDALAQRYLGQPMSAAHRAAVLAAAETLGSDPLSEPERLARVALPLLVDSPYFQLR